MIDRIQINTGAASGGAGAATATGYSMPVAGEILAVHIAYKGSPPAGTTDITLSDESDPASEAIISLTNAATDIKIYPRRVAETNDGTDLTYDGTRKVYAPYIVHGRLELTIAQANNDDYAIATVWVKR
jgi:hypothetical protein